MQHFTTVFDVFVGKTSAGFTMLINLEYHDFLILVNDMLSGTSAADVLGS
jgi:hypothetical protein